MLRAVLALALALSVVGCGAQIKEHLADTPRAMVDAGTSRTELTFFSKEKTVLTLDGVFDYEHRRGREIERRPPVAGEGEARFIDGSRYDAWMLLGKQRWIKEEFPHHPSWFDRFKPGPPAWPRLDRVLDRLLGSGTDAKNLGTNEVRGVSTTHYRIDVDKKPAGEPTAGVNVAVVDAWIDDDGLVRRLTLPWGNLTASTDFFDFGVKVDVEDPRAGSVVAEEEVRKCYDSIDRTGSGPGKLCAEIVADQNEESND